MCELLGLNFNRLVNPTFSFPGLLQGSDLHCDGFGVGCYPGQSTSALVIKEDKRGLESELAEFISYYRGLSSKIFIGHIRRTSIGTICYDNTHPFSRNFNNKEWLFAHNGTLPKRKPLRCRAYHPLGGTDSEVAFCFLLSQLKANRLRSIKNKRFVGYTHADFEVFHEILQKINLKGDGAFNTIFTDGRYLFCYRDIDGARDLYFIKRQHPFPKAILRDTDIEIDLNLHKGANEKGYIIASTHLSSEQWQSFEAGELIVFKDGRIVDNLK